MARAIITSSPSRRPTYEPLYDIAPPPTGATIEVFCDAVLARSVGARSPGWFWWSCRRGRNSYLAYRDAMGGTTREFGPVQSPEHTGLAERARHHR